MPMEMTQESALQQNSACNESEGYQSTLNSQRSATGDKTAGFASASVSEVNDSVNIIAPSSTTEE